MIRIKSILSIKENISREHKFGSISKLGIGSGREIRAHSFG